MSDDFELREELDGIQDLANYHIQNEFDFSAEDPALLLESAVEAVAENSESITDPQAFDLYRSFLKHVEEIPSQLMSKILDSISSALQAQLDATLRDMDTADQQTVTAHRKPLEMYSFLLNWFVTAVEKVKPDDAENGVIAPPPKSRRGRGGKAGAARGTAKGAGKGAGRGTSAAAKKRDNWTWEDQIPDTLALISKVLRLKTQKIWTTSVDRDAFISCITRPAYQITESEAYMKSHQIKLGVYKVICLAVKHHNHTLAAQISIMQALQYYEHLSEPMAECLTVLAKEFDHTQLGDEILREISAKSFSAQDTKGPRAFSRFLVRFAELAPRSVLKQISLLLAHLDSESYPMRVALVEVLGSLFAELATSPDLTSTDPSSSSSDSQSQIQKQLLGQYDLLLERTLDLSSYVRTKVFHVLTRLCDLPVKFPKQRLQVTRAAVCALEDKASGVRRAAVGLLGRLVLTHPYGLMHGGLLGMAEWEKRYEDVKKELSKVEGVVGKAVEHNEEGEEVEEEGTPKPKEKERKRNPNDMDVDENEEAEDEGEDEEDEDEDEDEEGDDEEGDEEEEEEGAGDGSVPLYEDDEDDEQDAGPSTPKPTKSKKLKKTKPRKPKKSKKAPRKSELDMEALTNEQAALAALESNQLLSLRLRKKYYGEALNFIRQLENAMDAMSQLLGSLNKGEVLEAMEFFRIAYEYQFDSAKTGIKKMLHLIWSKDNSSSSEDGKELKGIRSRVLECYRNLYFDPLPDMEAKDQVNRIAKNMIELTYSATLAELTSLEEMMRIMMMDNQIHQNVISKLWQVYSSDKQLPKKQRRGAILIIGMLALARRSVVTDRVDTLIKVGLGPLGKTDLPLANYTCVALQRLNGSAKKIKGSLLDKNLRLETTNLIFRKLQETIEYPCRAREWFALAEQAINTIYALAEHPDRLCDSIIKALTLKAFSRKARIKKEKGIKKEKVNREKGANNEDGEQKDEDEDEDAMDEDKDEREEDEDEEMKNADDEDDDAEEEGRDVGDSFELSQLLFVVGHVAIKHIVFLELIEREWKRQKDEKTTVEKKTNRDTSPMRTSKDGEELDQVAGNAEDEIGERIAGVRETELLYGPESLLALYGPMLAHVCGSPHKFKNRTLRAAATLAFSKFLCVSSQYCDTQHRLLFKILETSKDPIIRSNIVIALGDVAVSFSNIIDENSNELYKGLSDKNLVVKKNTLMVLTHLILNGMIKVKGQLGELAKCVEDPEQRIADLAKLFFTELSTKENSIYNNLPDVISHLSTGEHAVDEEKFQTIMRYIFPFIEKEKQAENIIDKLCQRFHISEDPRQWRDIAYCLSLLPYKSERSVKKLIDGLQFYRDKLHEKEVYELFVGILAKARSNKSANKPDTELNEFEQILEQHKLQGEEDQALEKRVEGKKAAAKKRATRKKAQKKAQPKPEDSE